MSEAYLMGTKIDKIDHIVYVKNMRITGRSICYSFVKIEAGEKFNVVNEKLYTGFIVYPLEYSGQRAHFYNSAIIKDFGNIPIDELIEKYPEYLL